MRHSPHSRHTARLLLAAVCAAAATAAAQAYTGQELAKEARISLAQARQVALKAHPGKIVDEELEHEEGGSGLRYTFEIRSGKGNQEVGVDAVTGALLENQLEGKTPD